MKSSELGRHAVDMAIGSIIGIGGYLAIRFVVHLLSSDPNPDPGDPPSQPDQQERQPDTPSSWRPRLHDLDLERHPIPGHW